MRKYILTFVILVIIFVITGAIKFSTTKEEEKEILNKPNSVQMFASYKLETYWENNFYYKDKKDEVEILSYDDPQAFERLNFDYETFEVTAYTAGYESTGKTSKHPLYGITASGNKVKENYTIACPKSMEFGTVVYIPYFEKTFVCEDRGSAITEGKLDVYVASLDEALDFGRRELKIKILN